MDESKKRTAMLRAKREFLEKSFSSDFFRKSDEDLKMIGVSSIDSLFSKVKIDEKWTGEDSTFINFLNKIFTLRNIGTPST